MGNGVHIELCQGKFYWNVNW